MYALIKNAIFIILIALLLLAFATGLILGSHLRSFSNDQVSRAGAGPIVQRAMVSPAQSTAVGNPLLQVAASFEGRVFFSG